MSFLLLAFLGCAAPTAVPADAIPPEPATPAILPVGPPRGLLEAVGDPVSIEARDLVLRLVGAEVHVPYLSGNLVPAGGGQIVDLESPRSFDVTVEALEVRIPCQTIQQAIAGGPDGPFRDLVVRTEGNSVLLDGHAGVLNLPFSFRATPMVTRSGGLGLKLEKVRVLGIGVKGFLGTFQGAIEKAANKKGHLLDIDEDWLVVNPFPFAGPPEIHAKFTSVEVRDQDIVARLGELTPREERKEPGGVLLKGGVMRNKKSMFFGVSLQLVAQDGGALVIDPETLDDQLERGLIKNTREGDIVVYVLAPGQTAINPIVRPATGPEETKTPPEPVGVP